MISKSKDDPANGREDFVGQSTRGVRKGTFDVLSRRKLRIAWDGGWNEASSIRGTRVNVDLRAPRSRESPAGPAGPGASRRTPSFY